MKNVRWFLISVIVLVLVLVLFNYIQFWRNRSAAHNKLHQILDPGLSLSAEGTEYSEYRSGSAKFKLRAEKRLETVGGKNFLQGVEAFNFNPDGSIKNSIHSNKATYDREKGHVEFSEKVRIRFSEGLEIETNSLQYNQNTTIGETNERLLLRSQSTNGSAAGIRFDQKNGVLNLLQNVDLTTIQRRTNQNGAKENITIHATAEKASFLESERKTRLQGAAQVKTDKEVFWGDVIETFISADKKKIEFVNAIGNAGYKFREGQETQHLSGDRIELAMEQSSGALKTVQVKGHASFLSNSKSDEMNLSASELYLDVDPANGFPTLAKGKTGVSFNLLKENEKNKGSGDEFRAIFAHGTKNLDYIQISGHAVINSTDKNRVENTIEAGSIWLFFKETAGKAALQKFQAGESARWASKPPKASGIFKTLSAAFLEVVYSSDGEFPESGKASGNVTLNAVPAGVYDGSFLRQLQSDFVQFHFFPKDNRLKDLYADGHVRVDYEKKAAQQKFHTLSDKMNVDFQASSTEGAVEKAEQWGKFRYEDESKSATAGRCTYEGAKELLIMTEAPEITDRQSGKTTGGRIEYDQKQKILYVHHHVRSILSAKKGDQSLLAGSDSSSPSVVTADEMQFYSEANRAYYAGNVLLLSAEQKLQSKELEIIKGGEQMEARGEVNHLIYKTDQNNKKKSRKTKGDSSDLPINVQSSKLNYIKATNQIHYSGNVKLQSPNYDLSAASLDVKWDKEGKKINRATARENVMIVEENKIGKGDTADYYLDPERFVLIGTPAQIDSFEKSQSTMRSTAPRLIFFVNEDKTRLETK